MDTTEIEIKGVVYRIGVLEAMMAFHVSRRLGPVLDGVVMAFRAATAGGDPLDSFGPMAEALADMSDEQADYVVRNCLSVVTRDMGEGKGWSRINNRGGGLMFDDITMPTMLTLVWKVLEGSLKDFFSELPSLSAKLQGLESTS